jgi:hypothetical protein
VQASRSVTDDGFHNDENIASNAPQDAPDEPETRDVSMPAGFAPSQVSSTRQELGGTAADAAGDASDEEQGQAAGDDLQQDVEATLSLQPSSYEMIADGVLDVPSDIDDVAASEVGQEDQKAEDRMENAADDDTLNNEHLENAAEDAVLDDAAEDNDVASAVQIALQGLPVPKATPSVSEMSSKTDPSPLALPENYQAEASTYCMVSAPGLCMLLGMRVAVGSPLNVLLMLAVRAHHTSVW